MKRLHYFLRPAILFFVILFTAQIQIQSGYERQHRYGS